MKLSAHLCLLTDGTLGRYPTVETDASGKVVSLTLHDVLEEEAGMVFVGGIMVCDASKLPGHLAVQGAEDFAENFKGHEVTIGCDDIGVLTGINLLTLEGTAQLSPVVGLLRRG